MNMTISVITCLIVKLVKNIGQTESKGQNNFGNFCLLLNHTTTFCLKCKLFKRSK